MKEKVLLFLKQNEIEIDEKLLQLPKIKEHGDLSLPCFVLAKESGKNPVEYSKELENTLNQNKTDFISKIESAGPFLNFTFNAQTYAKELLDKIEQFNLVDESQKILIEFPSPNTNKNLHIGHTRNMLLGNSLGAVMKKVGHEVILTNLNNDRGISICYAMLGYQEFISIKTPEDLGLKTDEYIAWCYAQISNKIKTEEKENGEGNSQTQKECMQMLEKWEANDLQVRELWKNVLDFVYKGYKNTYLKYKLPEFDKEFYESEMYDKGREIIEDALKKGVKGLYVDESGAVAIDLEDVDLGTKYLLRSNKTTLYMTQDIYLAKLKQEIFNPDKYIFVVGHEQEYHFNVLFEVLGRFGFGGVDKNYHYSYGFVFDKNGKKFSSRVGNTVGADEIYDNCINGAYENLKSREYAKNLSEEELQKRAEFIGFSALAFYFLKSAPTHSINFDIETALSFEGETGPYVQYTYARIQSVLKKSTIDVEDISENNLNFESSHIPLLEHLSKFNQVVLDAASKYKVSLIAHYIMQLTKQFNELYQLEQFIGNKKEKELLYLSYLCSNTIKEGLKLLHIDVLEEM